MGKLNIVDSVVINTNADKAWDIVGPNFLKISDWGRGINKSWENVSILKRIEDAPAAGRYCDVKGFGKFDERIIHYSSDSREYHGVQQERNCRTFLRGYKMLSVLRRLMKTVVAFIPISQATSVVSEDFLWDQ